MITPCIPNEGCEPSKYIRKKEMTVDHIDWIKAVVINPRPIKYA